MVLVFKNIIKLKKIIEIHLFLLIIYSPAFSTLNQGVDQFCDLDCKNKFCFQMQFNLLNLFQSVFRLV